MFWKRCEERILKSLWWKHFANVKTFQDEWFWKSCLNNEGVSCRDLKSARFWKVLRSIRVLKANPFEDFCFLKQSHAVWNLFCNPKSLKEFLILQNNTRLFFFVNRVETSFVISKHFKKPFLVKQTHFPSKRFQIKSFWNFNLVFKTKHCFVFI